MKRTAWGCVALIGWGCAVDVAETDERVGEALSFLTQNQVAAMNGAAQGTGIGYGLLSPPGQPQTLTLQFVANGQIRRRSRYHFEDNSHVVDVIWPPDPCSGDNCKSPAVHLGAPTTAWYPPDPCWPPDPCKTSFDIAGANLRIVGNGGSDENGNYVTSFQVLDANSNVVFDSASY